MEIYQMNKRSGDFSENVHEENHSLTPECLLYQLSSFVLANQSSVASPAVAPLFF